MPKWITHLAATKLPMDGDFGGHIWLATSGSTSKNPDEIKFVALSKEAFLISAKSVNSHLEVSSSDVWINPLPHFHVGGLSIYARSHLSGMRVVAVQGKWDLAIFLRTLKEHQGTFSSLVPAQIFDIVAAGVSPHPSLKTVIVGGGHLSEHLYRRARELGWRLLPSYGMTEAASTIAIAGLDCSNQVMNLLPHLEMKIDESHLLSFKSGSLLSCYAYVSNEGCRIVDPKQQGWFLTEDRGELIDGGLRVWGRGEEFVKIGGENVSLQKLRSLLVELSCQLQRKHDLALIPVPDERLGHYIALVAAGEKNDEVEFLVAEFQKRVLPFEKIRRLYYLPALPRSPLGKLLEQHLISLLPLL